MSEPTREEMRQIRTPYRGWKITYNRYRPVTGVWRAERHGVGMNAGNLAQLKRMIDTHVEWPKYKEG